MTTVNRPQQPNQAQYTRPQNQVADVVTRSLIKALDVAIDGLERGNAGLKNIEGFLAQQKQTGWPPTELKAGVNAFAMMSQIPPGAAMAGGKAAMGFAMDSGDDYFGRAEIVQNIVDTFGPGSDLLAMRADKSIMGAQAALAISLQGGSWDQMRDVLGRGNPHTDATVQLVNELAAHLKTQPINQQAVEKAAAKLEWNLIHHATHGLPEGKEQANQLKDMWRQAYGIQSPGSRDAYTGAGAFGNAVHQAGGARAPVELPPGGTANARGLAMAQSQVGVREASGNNDGIPSQRYMNGRQEPWCANFVAWSFRESGNPLPGNQRSLASVQNMEDQMKAAGRFHRGTPQPGDVIFFKNRGDSDKGGGRHVGIVEKVENGRVYTVEGNSGNAVARRSYPLDNARIAGYGR